MRVLIVDDDKAMLRTFGRMLRSTHEVVLAEGAPEALALLGQGAPFDAILCDLHMPQMSGAAFADRLSAHDASRVIFTTGGAFNTGDALFLARHHVLPKPFTVQELRNALDSVCSPGASRGLEGTSGAEAANEDGRTHVRPR